ncbi:MAG: phosphoribosylamine--glycine ligase [Gammaproteobacteria bacterium]|nr:phosphoribosylamine--glycine ligase [Gammaproteobacteria bacterium]MBL7000115.1 phosphoribosylamine--glycine ligase [Gammaproteobacteria bacterium]
MKILIIGGGGREHALAWKAAQSQLVETVYVAPGNAGTLNERKVQNIDIQADAISALCQFALDNDIELTIVGPEAPLVIGVVDLFQSRGLKIFGPSEKASQLEGSKTFTKDFLARHNIPTAAYQSFTEIQPAHDYIDRMGAPIVIKADGLAAGKGVILADSIAQAKTAVRDMLAGNAFGDAGHRVVVEEFLSGEEASFICMVDGKNIMPMASSQDHKARDNGDKGPNTGGMGAYSPAPIVTDEMSLRVMQEIIRPTVDGMAAEGATYTGFLYAGLMIDAEGTPRVLEYNCRFGDPETQPIMMRLKSDLVEHCLAALEQQLDEEIIEWSDKVSLGVVLAAGGYPDHYNKGETIKNIPRETPDTKVFHAGTAINQQHQLVSNGGRVLCAVALGDNIQQAQQAAYQIVSQIDWPGAYYRSDIGFKAIK